MNPSPNVNLSNLKLHLAEAILEQERLQDKLKSQDISDGTQVDIIHQLDALKDSLDCFPDEYLQRAKVKRLKLDKHKAWKKRRKDRLKAIRQERNTLPASSSVQGQPTTSSIPSPTQQQESRDKEIQQQPKQHQQQKARQQQRIQQLTMVVEKLIHIRDLRRHKLEAKGHFFPETGDAFYHKVKLAATTSMAAEHHSDVDDSTENRQQQQKTIQPHQQDQWNGQPLDMDAYDYWLQGWKNVDKLRQIRQQWDEYLVVDGTPPSVGLTTASKIPPTMVSPSPPSSHLWARYLE